MVIRWGMEKRLGTTGLKPFRSDKLFHQMQVFSACLGASKAFDRTNHNILSAKLIKRDVYLRA